MRAFLLIGLLFTLMSANGQTEIVANPGEYVEAHNYGGRVELKRFLQLEMNYPTKALQSKTEGTVELIFVVDAKTGKTSDLKVKTSVSEELDAEAIRLQQLLLFSPSTYLGEKVTTRSSFKIKFSPKSYKRYCKKRGYNEVVYSDDLDKSDKIYLDNQVDIKPKMLFEDSLDNISTFLTKNLKYPEGTLRLNITGVVKLSFVVEPTGRITNIKVVQGLGGGASNESERLLKLLKWSPGEADGKKVRVSKIFEVSFNLSNDSGIDYVPTSY
jgi:TonB family protein